MRLLDIVREMNYAAARVTELKLMNDAGISDRVPDTYEEFLLLTALSRRESRTTGSRPAP